MTFLKSLKRCFKSLNQSRPVQKPKKRSRRLELEALETRLVPVVGAYGLPALAPELTGVVALTLPLGNAAHRSGPFCTGTLLSTGRHILTAASCITDGVGVADLPTIHVVFQRNGGIIDRELDDVGNVRMPVPSANYRIHPSWNGDPDDGYDIAILELPAVAPIWAQRHDLYRGTDEVDRWSYVVGYGYTGRADRPVHNHDLANYRPDYDSCNTGGLTVNDEALKRIGTNFFDGTDGPDDSRLESDFDSDTDDWAGAADPSNPSARTNEVGLAGGDLGGPSFLYQGPNSPLAISAITSWTSPDDEFLGWGDDDENGCFGAGMVHTRVSSFVPWIDDVMFGEYHLVVDMQYQPRANRIEVEKVGNNFRVRLDGQELFLHSDLVLANTRSITILGLPHRRETIMIDGTLGGQINVNSEDRVETSPNDLLVVRGTANSDTVTVGSVLIGFSTTGGVLPAAINYSSVRDVQFDTLAGIDTINVRSTNANTSVTVNAGNDNDTITLGTVGTGSTVTINGENGDDTLQGANTTNNWILSATGVGTVNGIRFSGFEELKGGTRTDTLVAPDAANSWNILSTKRAALNRTLFFESMENLSGGSGADLFTFNGSGRVAGTLDGKGGTDTLDYSRFVSGFEVNLYTRKAPGVRTGSLLGIENVTGGIGGDTITGTTGDNILRGGGGADHLFGLDGKDVLLGGEGDDKLYGDNHADVLIGGPGMDNLQGGAGEDILIGGWTNYDNDDAALTAIMQYWGGSTDRYDVRVNRLKAGVNLTESTRISLADGAVHDDLAFDTLTGGTTDLDWFWIGALDNSDRVRGLEYWNDRSTA